MEKSNKQNYIIWAFAGMAIIGAFIAGSKWSRITTHKELDFNDTNRFEDYTPAKEQDISSGDACDVLFKIMDLFDQRIKCHDHLMVLDIARNMEPNKRNEIYRQQASEFFKMEVAFDRMYERFVPIAKDDDHIKAISTISKNASIFCKKEAKWLLALGRQSKDQSELETKCLRAKAVFQNDEDDLRTASFGALFKYKKYLTKDDTEFISMVLMDQFGKDINKLIARNTSKNENERKAELDIPEWRWRAVTFWYTLNPSYFSTEEKTKSAKDK